MIYDCVGWFPLPTWRIAVTCQATHNINHIGFWWSGVLTCSWTLAVKNHASWHWRQAPTWCEAGTILTRKIPKSCSPAQKPKKPKTTWQSTQSNGRPKCCKLSQGWWVFLYLQCPNVSWCPWTFGMDRHCKAISHTSCSMHITPSLLQPAWYFHCIGSPDRNFSESMSMGQTTPTIPLQTLRSQIR